jgi:protease-4
VTRLAVRRVVPALAFAAAFLVAAHTHAAPPQATERKPTDGVDRLVHDYSSEGDASSLELNPALLSGMRGLDLTLLGYRATSNFTRGSGFGGFLGLNLGFGLAAAFGLQVVQPRLDDDVRDFDEAANPDITKLSFGLSGDMRGAGAIGISVHGVRADGRWIQRPDLDIGTLVRIWNYASVGVAARFAPLDMDTDALPAHLSVTGELAVRPLGTPHLELAGGVTQRVLTAEAGDPLQRRGLAGLFPRGRAVVRVQGWSVAGEVELVDTAVLDPVSLDRLTGEKTLRGSVSVGAAWDIVSVAGGVHAGVSEGVDGFGIKARLTSRPQGRVFWARRVDAERIDLSQLRGERDVIALLARLERAEAAGDRTVLVVDARGTRGGWATLHEIRDALVRIRDAGGHVFAYLENADLHDYYVASAAETIYVHPAGGLQTYGLSSTSIYFQGALEKLGVKAEVVKVDEYKSAGEPFTRTSPSKFDREQREALLDDTYGKIVHDIAQARGMSLADVRARIDGAPHSPEEAIEKGLADEVVFRDEILEHVSEKIGADVEFADFNDTRPADSWGTAPYIAVVLVEDTIIDGDSRRIPFLDIGFTGGDTIAETLRDLRDDKACRGIVLRVNSPGGSALASDVIWREVDKTRKAHESDPRFSPPVVVSMGDVAASGGYYVAMGSDHVLADPLTVTGSIGVISLHFDVSGLLGKLGISTTTFKRGEHADIESIFSPYSEAERERLERSIRQTYDLFTTRVADGREMKKEEVDQLGRGHVWSGVAAQKNGLVDELGGLRDAVERVRADAKIPKWRVVPLRVLPRAPRLLDLILDEGSGNPLERTGPVSRAVERRRANKAATSMRGLLPLALDAALSRIPLSLLFLPQKSPQAILPGAIELR